MASPRRLGAPNSKSRSRLLDAAERLMLKGGYAAVTSRRVASEARLKPQLVHYYFRTMDDLFLAVFRRRSDQRLDFSARALASARPLRALWELNADSRETALFMEFVALANHRKAIRRDVARYAKRILQMPLDAVASTLKRHGILADTWPPVVFVVAMTGILQGLAIEKALGLTFGHDETVSQVERFLSELEGPSGEAEITLIGKQIRRHASGE